jgi:hypothetical protein
MGFGGSSSYGQNTVTTVAEVLVRHRRTRGAVLIQNLHASNDLYVGPDASVTSANGILIPAGVDKAIPTSGPVYAIASAADTDVRFWEIY